MDKLKKELKLLLENTRASIYIRAKDGNYRVKNNIESLESISKVPRGKTVINMLDNSINDIMMG